LPEWDHLKSYLMWVKEQVVDARNKRAYLDPFAAFCIGTGGCTFA
jgi:hypothetical protein